MAINSKKKGSRGERMAVQFLKDWTSLDFARTPQSGGLRWKKTDNIAGDIVCIEPNYIFPFAIEVKFPKDVRFDHLLYDVKADLNKYWDQVSADSKRAQKTPLLLVRKNGLPSDFFFVFISKNFAKYLLKNGFKVGDFTPYLMSSKYLITTTQALKSLKYKEIEKLGLRWLKDLQLG